MISYAMCSFRVSEDNRTQDDVESEYDEGDDEEDLFARLDYTALEALYVARQEFLADVFGTAAHIANGSTLKADHMRRAIVLLRNEAKYGMK